MIKIPPPLALAAVTTLSELEPVIPFGLEWKESVSTVTNKSYLSFTVFYWGSLFVLLVFSFSSLSLSTNMGTDKYTEALGVA